MGHNQGVSCGVSIIAADITHKLQGNSWNSCLINMELSLEEEHIGRLLPAKAVFTMKHFY